VTHLKAGRLRKGALAAALCAALAPTTASAHPVADGSVVRAWDDLALQTVRERTTSDAVAARLYAMVNAAMYDAVNGTAGAGQGRTAALVAADHPRAADPAAAAAVAAHDVLVGLYPDRSAKYDRVDADVAAAPVGLRQQSQEWGHEVALGVLTARADDGSSDTEPLQPGGTLPGEFTGTWTGKQFQNLKPFVIADRDAYLGAGPPKMDTAAYRDAFNEVKFLGDSTTDVPGARDTFNFWSLQGGTDQPAGAWLQVAEAVSVSRSLSLADTARLFALESMAMADTVAPTYRTKFVFHHWRPTTAINRALEDGNPETNPPDYTWKARGGGVGSSPEYWSGHSSFSTAAATTLAGFFCDDAIGFTLQTDPGPFGASPARSYGSFSQAAAEAGLSRVLGGFHFPFSNADGTAAGRAIASEVLSKALLRTDGATHSGSCPL
jgi:PAP2 superfamily protein